MAGVAKNNSKIQESTKANHVAYVENYQTGTSGGGSDSNGNPIPSYPTFGDANWTSNAKIRGQVSSTGNVYVNGAPIAKQGDQTQETWQADPAPYAHYGGSITSVSPGTSGSGSGNISQGSSTVKVGGKAVAKIGSSVTTHLGNTTTIMDGSTNVFVN